jgi:hypothetical protein
MISETGFGRMALPHHSFTKIKKENFINVVLISVLMGGQGQVPSRDGKVVTPLDYSRYVRRFTSSLECGSQYCKELNYR